MLLEMKIRTINPHQAEIKRRQDIEFYIEGQGNMTREIKIITTNILWYILGMWRITKICNAL